MSFLGGGYFLLGVGDELATVRPSKRIFLMGDFSPCGRDGERGQKIAGISG